MPGAKRDQKGRVLRSGESQREDGRYMFRYTDATGQRKTVYSWRLVSTDKMPDGKRQTAPLRELEKKIQRDLDDGIRTGEADKIKVNDLYAQFMDLRTDLKTSTRCNYTDLYDKHVRNVLGLKPLSSVRYSQIKKLYSDLLNQTKLKPSTLEKINSILIQVFDLAVKDGIIRTNPATDALKSLRKNGNFETEKRHALTEAQQERFVDYVYGSRKFRRWGTLFTVLLGTGLRIGEALGLRWGDCDFKKGVITVSHALQYKRTETSGYVYQITEPKTKSGYRTIPMFREVVDALKAEQKRQGKPGRNAFTVDGYRGFIFLNSAGKVHTPGSVYEALQKITTDYNREEFVKASTEGREPIYLPKMSAHILRHTFCTRLCENEPNLKVIEDIMGHQNIRTTMDVYNEATAEKKVASFKKLEGKIKLA
jgi:integrase